MNFLWESLTLGFERIFDGDPFIWATAWRTLRLALISTAIALVLGTPIGLWLAERRSRGRRLGLVLANAGLGLPPVVLGVFLALLMRPANLLGPLHLAYTLEGLVVAQTLLALPIVVALVAAAVSNLPAGLLDQAQAFGASRGRRAALALREARVGVLAAVMAALLSALAEVGAVILVGGNIRNSTNTLASTVLIDLSAADFASATAVVMVLLAMVLVVGGLLTVVQQRATR